MKLLNDRIAKIEPPATIKKFLNLTKENKQFEKIEMCFPNSFGFKRNYFIADTGLISQNNCFGCLCCIEKDDANSFDNNGVPIKANNEYLFENISYNLFKGLFIKVGPNPKKFWLYTASDEKNHTTPILANLLYYLSKNINDIAIRCSPNWEISIDTADKKDPREGHLDLAIVNYKERKLIVGEVKSSIINLLRDIKRDQWARYKSSIEKISSICGYKSIFCYFIGGDEFSLYPPADSDRPKIANDRAVEFFEFIKKDDKIFISLEAIRGLKIQKLSTHPNLSWEDCLFKVFYKSNSNLGLISGGVLTRELKLLRCPW
ncbi:MAG: hypothetical protein OP8BY_1547 [Candidatus Saccharicenans subterraneus]|uniref:Uncharacterized protein n=1 Tax=Candidatus Saccharicenans subterraneus TaxID=2508984 RepID=A0A3E2BNQ8_9BACT|nr:MAG: hypothetical protein OP8BY_1547 [Candidatus Saccharicenans subterraneum]